MLTQEEQLVLRTSFFLDMQALKAKILGLATNLSTEAGGHGAKPEKIIVFKFYEGQADTKGRLGLGGHVIASCFTA